VTSLLFWPQVLGPIATLSPVTHDPYFSSVSLLAHFDNNLTNSASHGNTPFNTIGSAAVSATQSKFGGFSLNVPGTTSGVGGGGTSSDYSFGTGDHTIELWVYLSTVTTAQNLIDFRSVANQASPTIYVTGGTVRYFSSNADRITSGASIISTNTWTNICLCRASGTSKLFVGGTQTGSDYADTQNSAANVVTIGVGFNSIAGISGGGYVDEVRVTKGVARYTANYTVATAAFPNV
jgi:hypothetical protein